MDKRRHIFDRQDSRLFLDIVKGVAIFLMLWGHCIQYCALNDFDFFENPVFKFIYSFHMPLFMLVSGYLFAFSCRKRDLRTLLVHRTQGLLQPIVFCTMINYLLTNVIAKRHFANVFSAKWMSELNSLWFLWSVLAASIIIGVAYKAPNKRIMQIIIAVLGFGFVCLFPNAEMNEFMYPYFLIGFIFAFVKDKIPKSIKNIKYLSLVIFPVLLFFFQKRDYIYTTGLISKEYDIYTLIGIDLNRWAIGLIGSIFVLVILEWFVILMKKAKPLELLGQAISRIGQKSLQIYCISVSLLSSFLPKFYSLFCERIVGHNLFAQNMVLYNFLFTPLIAIGYAAVLYYLIRLLEKTKISKVIFGR